jgi:hypothetical protein
MLADRESVEVGGQKKWCEGYTLGKRSSPPCARVGFAHDARTFELVQDPDADLTRDSEQTLAIAGVYREPRAMEYFVQYALN